MKLGSLNLKLVSWICDYITASCTWLWLLNEWHFEVILVCWQQDFAEKKDLPEDFKSATLGDRYWEKILESFVFSLPMGQLGSYSIQIIARTITVTVTLVRISFIIWPHVIIRTQKGRGRTEGRGVVNYHRAALWPPRIGFKNDFSVFNNNHFTGGTCFF